MLRNYYYNSHMYAEELQEILSQLKDNTNHHGIHLLKNAVLTDRNANKIIKRLEHMKKNIHNENSISIIDPDSRHMEDKKGIMGLNYNYQVGVDLKYGFIVDNYITQNPNDKNELITLTKRLNTILGSDDYILVADHGYWKIKHIEEIYNTNTMIIIPDRGAATRQKISNALKNKLELNQDEITKSTFKKYNFIFLPEEDVYICRLECY